ncbi:MAG TPA: Bax inhibitor-1 family protein [Kofleriaceae bacterium]|nr:Bax inhibitor-1 family protein [Kofleriaceae bacterium]
MFAQAAARNRPIAGAVATLGVSDRVTFLRRTYGLLGIALVGFALLTGCMMAFASTTSLKFSMWALTGRLTWLLVMGLFMVIGYVAQRLALSQTSRGLQLLGLGLAVLAESIILQPLLWFVLLKFGSDAQRIQILTGQFVMSGQAGNIIMESVVITLSIFVGLTAVVFISKKDFSFMRGILTIASFAALGVILASMLFGFHLGAIFLGVMILLMAGYILYQTSLVMTQFPPQSFVAAALMLFSTIATLFFYVLQLMASLQDRR